MKTVVACFASLLALSTLAAVKPDIEGAVPGKWTMDFAAAKKVAAEKKLPLLLNFTGSDWCSWCQLMDEKVFSQEKWAAYAKDSLLLVWIDFPNDKSLVPEKFVSRNNSLKDDFGVRGFPTFFLLDDNGVAKLGQLGADQEITPEKFIANINVLLKNRSSVVEALLKTLPEKTVQEYRDSAKKLTGAEAELKILMASYDKRRTELTQEIVAQTKRLDEIRLEARLKKLPEAKVEVYRTKKSRFDAVTAEIDAWISTKPERNEANNQKFGMWRKELESLQKEMDELLDNK